MIKMTQSLEKVLRHRMEEDTKEIATKRRYKELTELSNTIIEMEKIL